MPTHSNNQVNKLYSAAMQHCILRSNLITQRMVTTTTSSSSDSTVDKVATECTTWRKGESSSTSLSTTTGTTAVVVQKGRENAKHPIKLSGLQSDFLHPDLSDDIESNSHRHRRAGKTPERNSMLRKFAVGLKRYFTTQVLLYRQT